MQYNFSTLQVEKVIIHDIPRHMAGEEGVSPTISEIECNLTQELKNYFKEKINGSVTSSTAFDVIFNPSTSSPVPNLVCDCINPSGQDFITISQQIANHLFNIQTGLNSGGLLAVIECILEDKHSLAILKLEREEGVRLQTTKRNGKLTFNLDLIRQLMLTRKTKLFKIGLFVQPGTTVATIKGVVCDYQRGFDPKSEIADFFLSKFLGCQLTLEPDVATKRFFQTSEQFFNEEIADATVRGQYLTHLFSELTSQRNVVNPREFADNNLRANDKQRYISYLEEHEAPNSVFDKDINLIESRIARMYVQFQSGVSIIAPNDIFKDRVHLSQLESGETHAEITDRVKHMGSKT